MVRGAGAVVVVAAITVTGIGIDHWKIGVVLLVPLVLLLERLMITRGLKIIDDYRNLAESRLCRI